MFKLAAGTIAVAVALVAAAPAAAAGTLHPLGTGTGVLTTDGSRHAAYQTGERTARVLSRRAGWRDIAAPDGCAVPTLQATGPGVLLWSCRNPEFSPPVTEDFHFDLDYRVQRIRSGLSTSVAGQDGYDVGAGGDRVFFDRIGRDWVSGWYIGYHTDHVVYLNWRTGQGASADYMADMPDLSGVAPDLDSDTLLQPLCPPVRRRERPNLDEYIDDVTRYLPALQGRRWSVAQATAAGLGHARRSVVVVARCGGRRPHRHHIHIGNGGTEGYPPPFQLGAGLLSFSAPRGGVAVHQLWTRRTWRWSGDGSPAHTANEVFLSACQPDGTCEISSAEIPR